MAIGDAYRIRAWIAQCWVPCNEEALVRFNHLIDEQRGQPDDHQPQTNLQCPIMIHKNIRSLVLQLVETRLWCNVQGNNCLTLSYLKPQLLPNCEPQTKLCTAAPVMVFCV